MIEFHIEHLWWAVLWVSTLTLAYRIGYDRGYSAAIDYAILKLLEETPPER